MMKHMLTHKFRWTDRLRQWSGLRSLRSQLLARSLIILAVLLLLIGILQFSIMESFLYRSQAKTMEQQLRSMPPVWLGISSRNETFRAFPSGQGSPDDRGNGGRFLFIPDRSLAIIEGSGQFQDVFGSDGLAAPRLPESEYSAILNQLNDQQHVTYRIVTDASGKEQLIVFSTPGPRNHGFPLVQMGTETKPFKDLILKQLMIFIALSLLALVAGLVLYAKAMRRTLVPLSNMVDTVQRIDAGSLAERVPAVQGQREIDQLAQSFNGMLERLERSFEAERASKERMQRFLSDASHELRTPLTSIHGFIEVLQRGAANNEEQLHRALNSMHGESVRINKLVEDLLMLTKLDQAPRLEHAEVRLDGLLRDMEPQLLIMAGERTVHFDLTADLHVSADPHKLKQVVLNLFQNAVQHTDPTSGRIALTLYAVREHAELSIADNGIGIDREHLPHIFERFYRTSSSRSRKQGGAGLGLAITGSIVEMHGGSIMVTSKPGSGTAFKVLLPLMR